jgi:hypothetical protein
MDKKLQNALNSWRELNHVLHAIPEDELKVMLDHEVLNAKRIAVVERLHQRYCTLRTSRERMELLGKMA